jgi:hypothetical protein
MRRAGFDYAGWLGAGCLIGSDWLRQPRSARKDELQTWTLSFSGSSALALEQSTDAKQVRQIEVCDPSLFCPSCGWSVAVSASASPMGVCSRRIGEVLIGNIPSDSSAIYHCMSKPLALSPFPSESTDNK